MNSVFKALADPTRREILNLLRERPCNSGEIASIFSSAWPTISRHLAVLRNANLIIAERNGQFIRYEINTSIVQDLIQYLLAWGKTGD